MRTVLYPGDRAINAAETAARMPVRRPRLPVLLAIEVQVWRKFAAHVKDCEVCRWAPGLDELCQEGRDRLGAWDAAEAAIADVLLPAAVA